jgi:hypothetical protein
MASRKAVIIATVVALGAAIAGYKALSEFNRKNVDPATVAHSHEVNAHALYEHVVVQGARERYMAGEPVVLVRGVVQSMEPSSAGSKMQVMLDAGTDAGGISCEVDADKVPERWRVGVDVAIKGIVKDINEDELFGRTDIIMQRCVPVL